MQISPRFVAILRLVSGIVVLYVAVAFFLEDLRAVWDGISPWLLDGYVTGILLAGRALMLSERTDLDWAFVMAGGVGLLGLWSELEWRVAGEIQFVTAVSLVGALFLLSPWWSRKRRPPFSRRDAVSFAIVEFKRELSKLSQDLPEGQDYAARVWQLEKVAAIEGEGLLENRTQCRVGPRSGTVRDGSRARARDSAAISRWHGGGRSAAVHGFLHRVSSAQRIPLSRTRIQEVNRWPGHKEVPALAPPPDEPLLPADLVDPIAARAAQALRAPAEWRALPAARAHRVQRPRPHRRLSGIGGTRHEGPGVGPDGRELQRSAGQAQLL